jgi:hypothetical protein
MIDKAPTGTGTSPGDGGGERPRENGSPAGGRRRSGLTLEELGPLWESFRTGGVVACPVEAGSLALSVDGNNAYRLVCTRCGTASSWFEAAPAGIRPRTVPPGPDDDSADI